MADHYERWMTPTLALLSTYVPAASRPELHRPRTRDPRLLETRRNLPAIDRHAARVEHVDVFRRTTDRQRCAWNPSRDLARAQRSFLPVQDHAGIPCLP